MLSLAVREGLVLGDGVKTGMGLEEVATLSYLGKGLAVGGVL